MQFACVATQKAEMSLARLCACAGVSISGVTMHGNSVCLVAASKDTPKTYGPHTTLYNRFVHWSRLCVFQRIFDVLAN